MARKIAVFGEDFGHEVVISSFLNRFAKEHAVAIRVHPYSATGGVTQLHYEFQQFLKQVDRDRIERPDLVVVATDSNCRGYLKRRQEIERVAADYPLIKDSVAFAIPDPHVERWLLTDPAAFKEVLGCGCTLPKLKCDRDVYKHLLDQEVRNAGVRPLIRGLEYAEGIVNAMNLPSVEKHEPSLEKFIKELRARFNQWKQQNS